MKLLNLLRTLLTRFLLLLLMLIIALPLGLFLLLPARWRYDNKVYFWCCYVFFWMVLKISFLPIIIEGQENLPEGPAIIVANHQSSLDIPLIVMVIKAHPHIWLAKQELLESPILRFILPRMAVLIDTTTPQKGLRSLIQASNLLLEKNRHAIIFPEGGRFTDGKVHDFFGGFVLLAKKVGRPVVPVRIFDVNKAYPPDAFILEQMPIRVVIGKPFVYNQEVDTDEEFKNKVYGWFLEQEK